MDYHIGGKKKVVRSKVNCAPHLYMYAFTLTCPGVCCKKNSCPSLLLLHSQYADPVADLLDKWGAFRARLFRESCVFHRGNYVKDLSRLGRDLTRIIIVDNSPASYVFHPDNAVSSWTTSRFLAWPGGMGRSFSLGVYILSLAAGPQFC